MRLRPTSEAPPRTATEETREPLLRLGGLYENRTGKGIGGNIYLSGAREGSVPLGPQLIDLVKRGIAENRPLRFMVFENNGKFPSKSPFSLHVTLGYARETEGPSASPSDSRGYREPPPDPYRYDEAGDDYGGESDAVAAEPPPPPPPAIRRRTAPRRM